MTSRSHLTALPNLLTYARIIAIPVIIILALTGDPAGRWISFVLYAAAAVTDYLDGYFARKWQVVSPLGRMLDPIADKLLTGALLVALAADGTIAGWSLVPAIAILLREIFVSGLREFMGPLGVVVHVTKLAKWKTAAQLVALGALILVPLVPGFNLVALLLLWLAGLLTVWTGWDYFRSAWPHLRDDGT